MHSLFSKRSLIALCVAALAVAGISGSEERLMRHRAVVKKPLSAPPPLLEYFTFGHKRGIAAYLWLETLTWYGGLVRSNKKFSLDAEQAQFIDRQSEAMINLDPEFPDPYSFAYIVLSWYAKQPQLALKYAEKGYNQFPNDWNYAFYYGFVHYWFFKDNKTAARFFLIAGTKPHAPPFVALLGAKLLRKSGGTPEAIASLEQLLQTALPDKLRDDFKRELMTLQQIQLVEEAIADFQKSHDHIPSMEELISKGILQTTPLDGYQHPLIIEPDGSVHSMTGGLH